jgi:putative ABC transport system permease protein
MSLFRIALRSILQRGVASLLTMFSMALGVMLVVAVLSIHGVVSQSFRNNASLGYNMIVGAKGGREQLTLNTVFYLSQPVENIPYTYYLEFLKRDDRDRIQANSFGVESQHALRETTELLAQRCGGIASLATNQAVSGLGLALVPDARTEPHFPPIETGRDGLYGPMTELAIPLCLGDFFGRFRVVGTTPDLFDDLVYDIENNRKFEFAQGRNFHWRDEKNGYFEAVVGATVARELGVTVGQEISPRHGDPEGHTHARKFTVVGILRSSGTPNDRAVFVNMEGFYLMEDHAKPLEEARPEDAAEQPQLSEEEAKAQWQKKKADAKKKASIEHVANPDPLPVEQREVTAILLKVPYMFAPGLENAINEGTHAQAVLPVAVIYGLFEFIVKPIEWTLLILTAMICIVSGISILVSIYNSMSERRGEIAVMRALGAGRGTVMTIILLEATLLALGGGFLGWLAGHSGTWAISPWIEQRTGVQVGFGLWEPAVRVLTLLGATGSAAERFTLPVESLLIPALVLLAILVGIWPAISAYRTDVAKSLGK